jgi:hypothetical protein
LLGLPISLPHPGNPDEVIITTTGPSVESGMTPCDVFPLIGFELHFDIFEILLRRPYDLSFSPSGLLERRKRRLIQLPAPRPQPLNESNKQDISDARRPGRRVRARRAAHYDRLAQHPK